MMSKEKTDSNRNIYIDFLKVIAIILIIVTHDPWSVNNADLLPFVFGIDMAVPVFMIVSGYNYANGKHDIIKDEYKPAHILKRLKRFLIPYMFVFLGEVILLFFLKNKEYTIKTLLVDFVKGGYGPGAYYTPIMVQFVFLVPILWYIYNQYGIKVIFLVNVCFELIYTFMNLPEAMYQFCIIRYFFLISLGFEMKKREDKANRFLAFSFIIGVFYLLSTSYFYEPIVFKRWTTTSMIVGFYLLPILVIGKIFFDKSVLHNHVNNTLTVTSNATFHIYLVQMVYYYLGVQRIFDGMTHGVRTCLSILVCVVCGNIFYIVMNKVLNIGLKKSV